MATKAAKDAPIITLLGMDMPGHGETKPEVAASHCARDIAAVVEEALAAFADDNKSEEPKTLALAHSLGSEVALHLAATNPNISGLVLLAPAGLRNHQAMRPAWGARFGGSPLVLDTPLLSDYLLIPLLRLIWIRVFGFNPRTTTEEIVWGQRRAARFDWDAQARHAAAVGKLGLPVLLFFAEDDPLIESAVSEELAEGLKGPPDGGDDGGGGLGGGSNVTVVRFASGGHNIMKSRATEIGKEIVDWVAGLR